jgi:hypothetical protein
LEDAGGVNDDEGFGARAGAGEELHDGAHELFGAGGWGEEDGDFAVGVKAGGVWLPEHGVEGGKVDRLGGDDGDGGGGGAGGTDFDGDVVGGADALAPRGGVKEGAMIAGGFEVEAAELGGDKLGGDVLSAGRGGAPFEEIRAEEMDVAFEGVRGDAVDGGAPLDGDGLGGLRGKQGSGEEETGKTHRNSVSETEKEPAEADEQEDDGEGADGLEGGKRVGEAGEEPSQEGNEEEFGGDDAEHDPGRGVVRGLDEEEEVESVKKPEDGDYRPALAGGGEEPDFDGEIGDGEGGGGFDEAGRGTPGGEGEEGNGEDFGGEEHEGEEEEFAAGAGSQDEGGKKEPLGGAADGAEGAGEGLLDGAFEEGWGAEAEFGSGEGEVEDSLVGFVAHEGAEEVDVVGDGEGVEGGAGFEDVDGLGELVFGAADEGIFAVVVAAGKLGLGGFDAGMEEADGRAEGFFGLLHVGDFVEGDAELVAGADAFNGDVAGGNGDHVGEGGRGGEEAEAEESHEDATVTVGEAMRRR